MGLHKSFDRQFVLVGGAVMTNGGSLDLSRGEIGIFDTNNVTENGATAVASFKGMPKTKLFEIRYRETDDITSSRSKSSKTFKSFPFSLEDVLALRVSTPKNTEASVDEVVVGWNGIDESTALKFRIGDKKNASVELSGEAIGMLGYPNATVTVPMFFDAGDLTFDECVEGDPCASVDCTKVVERAIEGFKQFKLRGGVPVTDYVEITPIRSCAPTETELTSAFYELTICDTGDSSALSLIRQQYPGLHIERIVRNGAFSTYQLLQSSTAPAPAAYQQTLPSLIKGCKDCPAGYTAVEGGLVYAVTIEDDGADLTSVVEGLPNYVEDTAKKADGQEHGVGFYTVVLSNKLTSAQIATFVGANPTATLELVGTAEAVCNNSAVTNTAWIKGEEIKQSERSFYIDLPDTNCDGLSNRLEELQAAYPTLNITLAQSGASTRTITLTGASGTANISIGGVDYLATFSSNLATTANNFVNSHAAAIFTATGATVKASGSTIVVTDATAGFPAITVTNATSDLAGTVSAIAAIPVTGGCQTRYETKVKTNFRDVVCDPIFLDAYSAEAPLPYDGREWKAVEVPNVGTNCLCGFKVKGKLMQIFPTECVIDDIAFVEDSVKIRVSGGWISDIREGIGRIEDTPFNVEYLSYAKKRTHMGYGLKNFEDQSRTYFSGDVNVRRGNVEKFLNGVQSNINYESQYIDYALVLRRDQFSQGMSEKHNSYTTFHIQVEVGRQQAIEDLLNALAAQAGVSGVKALA